MASKLYMGSEYQAECADMFSSEAKILRKKIAMRSHRLCKVIEMNAPNVVIAAERRLLIEARYNASVLEFLQSIDLQMWLKADAEVTEQIEQTARQMLSIVDNNEVLFKDKERSAIKRIVEANLYMTVALALPFCGCGVSLKELIEVGNDRFSDYIQSKAYTKAPEAYAIAPESTEWVRKFAYKLPFIFADTVAKKCRNDNFSIDRLIDKVLNRLISPVDAALYHHVADMADEIKYALDNGIDALLNEKELRKSVDSIYINYVMTKIGVNLPNAELLDKIKRVMGLICGSLADIYHTSDLLEASSYAFALLLNYDIHDVRNPLTITHDIVLWHIIEVIYTQARATGTKP